MNIIFYSDFRPGISDIVDDVFLRHIAGKSCRVGYIPSDSDPKRRYFDKVADRYGDIGITDLTYFDLGEEFSPDKIPDLLSCDAIHLSGGDPERFMALIRQRQFGEQLKRYLQNGGLLVGISAGAMILTPTLGLVTSFEKNKSASKSPKALRFLNFEFYPHFKQDDSTTKQLAQYAKATKTTVFACDDDAGISIKNEKIELLGNVTRFNPM